MDNFFATKNFLKNQAHDFLYLLFLLFYILYINQVITKFHWAWLGFLCAFGLNFFSLFCCVYNLFAVCFEFIINYSFSGCLKILIGFHHQQSVSCGFDMMHANHIRTKPNTFHSGGNACHFSFLRIGFGNNCPQNAFTRNAN